MKAVIEENESLLRFYGETARVVSSVLLGGGVVWLLIFVFWVLAAADAAGELPWPGTSKNVGYAITTFVSSFVVPGTLALLIAQFIRYVLSAQGRPGWLLRHGNWILYTCGVILLGQGSLALVAWQTGAVNDPDQAGLLFVGPVLVPLLAKVLVCVALGQVLRRLLPIIEESKTLV